MKKNKIKNNKGFTLIELMVVISIIGLMSSVVLAALSDVRSKARDTKKIGELKSIEKALNLYALNNGGGVPMSSYHSWADVPKTQAGTIDCLNSDLVNNNNNLYDTLIAAKALSQKPLTDNLANQGYCYVYMTNENAIAGVSYDQYGNQITGPLAAVITVKSRSAMFAAALEKTKTLDGYSAIVAISYGNNLIPSNINLTTGIYNNVGQVLNNVNQY